VNGPRKARRPPTPLDQQALEQLALGYVGRFATTRAKLGAYLARKLRERGWSGAGEPDPAAIAGRLATIGYIDDRSYALAKARALSARGYGERRLADALRAAGVAGEDQEDARLHGEEQAVEAALRFAERRRIGPYAAAAADPPAREKALAAMVRAGHGFGIAKAIVTLAPGTEIDRDALADRAGIATS